MYLLIINDFFLLVKSMTITPAVTKLINRILTEWKNDI